MSPIIKVENISKCFMINHERKESYATLSNVMNNKMKNAFKWNKKDGPTKEKFWALKDISFEVQQGDRLGIIGRNGAGKSTLLKTLSRITEPTNGRISIKGRVASLLEVGTGFHPELTGRENIFLNGAILGMGRAEIRKKFDEIVAFAEVEKFLDTPVKRYSSGMYVRLAFAVAAHLEPEILIVDEVLAVGDTQFQKKCLGKMEDVSKNEGRTVLFVSHNMGVIAQLCNKSILLNRGMIEEIGATDRVVQHYINEQNHQKNNIYEIDNSELTNKQNYFTKIYTSKVSGEYSSDFAFDENIVLNFEFVIKDISDGILVGIALLDKYQNRVTTFLKNVSYFEKKGNKYNGKLTMTSSIIAPNTYSFLSVLWVRNGPIYDNIEAICSLKIHDNGTEFALYEGADYGNILLNADWQ